MYNMENAKCPEVFFSRAIKNELAAYPCAPLYSKTVG